MHSAPGFGGIISEAQLWICRPWNLCTVAGWACAMQIVQTSTTICAVAAKVLGMHQLSYYTNVLLYFDDDTTSATR